MDWILWLKANGHYLPVMMKITHNCLNSIGSGTVLDCFVLDRLLYFDIVSSQMTVNDM